MDNPDVSHPFMEITSLNFRSSPCRKGPWIRFLREPSLDQQSNQNFRLLSLPGIHLMPFSKMSTPLFMVTHTLEQGSLFWFLELILCLVQYLLFNTLAHRVCPSERNLQFNLASKDRFLPLAMCKPSPPSLLSFVILFHSTQCIFLSTSKEPQRKLRLTLLMLSRILFGKALHWIKYAGIVEKEAWTRTALPTKDNRLAFHPANFAWLYPEQSWSPTY